MINDNKPKSLIEQINKSTGNKCLLQEIENTDHKKSLKHSGTLKTWLNKQLYKVINKFSLINFFLLFLFII